MNIFPPADKANLSYARLFVDLERRQETSLLGGGGGKGLHHRELTQLEDAVPKLAGLTGGGPHLVGG